MAQILPTASAAQFQSAIQRAVTLLRSGEVVALPTETVYGLAANALNPEAVQKIFTIKGRPGHNPIIVHVSSLEMAQQHAAEWPERATRLATAFWPGPLTLVVTKSPKILDLVTAGGKTVGLRWPKHAVMQAVIEGCGFPLAAPSANLSNQLSPTTVEHVSKAMGDRVPLILDGGPAEIGIESTVVDLSTEPPRILRPGMIHIESLEAVIGSLAQGQPGSAGPLRSPGLLLKHYSPKAKVVLWDGAGEPWSASPLPRSHIHLLARTKTSARGIGRVSVMPRDPVSFARALYAELHRSDEENAALIFVEAVPTTPEWQGVADRLARAAGGTE